MMSRSGRHFRAAQSSVQPPWELAISPEDAGWGWSSLRILSLAPGASVAVPAEGIEFIVLPLHGSCEVTVGDITHHLRGRNGVFSAVTDFAYVGLDQVATITSASGGRFALPASRARRELPFRYVSAADVSVEFRGTGSCSRQVVNFCTPDTFEADRLIACEVLTPGGNWSSYPPHKHDVERDGETQLEEIYYFEVADGPHGPGMAYQRVYASDEREIDVLEEVRTGDTVLIPHGWHGPSIAAPGYDLYYLNVMAGPGQERLWLICDDPAHAWVRQTWQQQEIDPRLPLILP